MLCGARNYTIFKRCCIFHERAYTKKAAFVKNAKIAPKTLNSRRENIPRASLLPIPQNIDVTESTRFSPLRNRDISHTVLSQNAYFGKADIDITNTMPEMSQQRSNMLEAPVLTSKHVDSYDCFGAISLNSVMQSNVPTPYSHHSSHLNMPGGQWSQEEKFMAHNLQESHYTFLRRNVRSNWAAYDQNAVVNDSDTNNNTRCMSSSQSNVSADAANAKPLSKREQLKKAFKEYGGTIVGFHVAISLVSLQICYLLVSRGIDMVALLEYIGMSSDVLSQKVAAGTSTFVVAYAVHKVLAPIRMSITLFSAPFIVSFLRNRGFLKPNPSVKGK